jgi:hypothetical protein
MPLHGWEDMGRNAYASQAGRRLGRAQLEATTHLVGRPLHPHRDMEQVDARSVLTNQWATVRQAIPS